MSKGSGGTKNARNRSTNQRSITVTSDWRGVHVHYTQPNSFGGVETINQTFKTNSGAQKLISKLKKAGWKE